MILNEKICNMIYDFLEENKKSIIASKGVEKTINLIKEKFEIDFSNYNTKEEIVNFLTKHWDKKCKMEGCDNIRKQFGILPNRHKYNNCSTSYGIYKYCGEECNYKSIQERQMGDRNTSHRMSNKTKERVRKNNSEIMKNKIRNGEFIPCVTNSWARSRCNIQFERNGELVKLKTRSTWEAFYQLANPELLYESVVIPYVFDGVDKNYIVDFVDVENKILYEIKPNSERNSKIVKVKEKYARKWCNENRYKYEIIGDEWFFENFKKYSYLINGQEDFDKLNRNLKQFKNEN